MKRFKDLVEGKKYSCNKSINIFTKKDGLLYSLTIGGFSNYTMSHVSKMNFEEVIEYVTYVEAVKVIANGGIASFRGENYFMNEMGLVSQGNYPFSIGALVLTNDMLTKKEWIIIMECKPLPL